MRKVSIVIPCFNERAYIEKCIQSILNSDYSGELEVLVADGMSDDGTSEILSDLSKSDTRIHHLKNEKRTTPYALNLGIQQATGDFVMILGAHSELDSNYLTVCTQLLEQKPEVGCVGGLLRNVSFDQTSSVISAAMSSSFGVGSAHFRTGSSTGYVDTVAFGMYRKEVFEKIGYFDTDLTRNQDDEFNFRLLKQSGFKIYLTDKAFITYFVRASFKKLWKQYYQYGYWKVLVNRKHGSITTFRQVVPAIWVLGLIIGLPISVFFKWIAVAYLGTIGFYLFGAVFFAMTLPASNKLGIIRSFVILHFAYGFGYLKGIWHFMVQKRNNAAKVLAESSRVTRLTILTQYFPPEVGAPQNRLYELAERIHGKGVEVEIITAMPNYPKMEIQKEYKGKWYCKEVMGGMTVHRCAIFVSKNKSIFIRLINYFSFVFTSFFLGLFKARRTDFIMCESPPLFLGISAWLLCKFKGAKLIFNVSDLWPESAEKLGLVTNKVFLKAATILEEWLYRKSRLITGQTMGIVENISGRFPQKDVHWLPNGVNPELFTGGLKDPMAWRLKNGYADDDFILIYAGIIGYAQGLDIILDAAGILKDQPKIKFILLGNGPEKERLMEAYAKSGLNTVSFMDFVQKKDMPEILGSIDGSIIPLKKLDLFKGAIPSKIFECLASEKPILLGVDGEARTLFIEQGNAGLFFAPENANDLAAKILELYSSPELAKSLGKNGREYVSLNFSRDLIANKFRHKLEQLN